MLYLLLRSLGGMQWQRSRTSLSLRKSGIRKRFRVEAQDASAPRSVYSLDSPTTCTLRDDKLRDAFECALRMRQASQNQSSRLIPFWRKWAMSDKRGSFE